MLVCVKPIFFKVELLVYSA